MSNIVRVFAALVFTLLMSSCTTDMPETVWTELQPYVYCVWLSHKGACARQTAENGTVVHVDHDAEPSFVMVGDRWALNTTGESRTSAEIPDKLFEWGELSSAFTVAAVVHLDELPRERMVAVSKWETRSEGRSFELGMEWDGYPYFMVSSDGETSSMGIVYSDVPIRPEGSVMLVGVYDAEEGTRIYANGELLGVNAAVVPPQLFIADTPLLIANRPGCSSGCAFDGAIGDVGFFDHALSGEEVQEVTEAFGMTESMRLPFEEPDIVRYDLDEVGDLVQTQLQALDSGEGPGQYLWNATDDEPQLYSSADVAWIRWIMNDLDDLTDEQRRSWIEYIQAHQSEDGGSYPGANVHDEFHAIAHVTAALRMLGGDHRYPVTFIGDYLDTSTIGTWLDERDWFFQWGSSCSVWGLGLVALSTPSTSEEWRETFFAWLDAEVDPEIGAWRRGYDVRDPVDYLGGGFHIWTLYVLDGKPIPYADQAVDLVLSLQTADGDYGRSFGCGTLDGVWALATLKDVTDHRAVEVDVALRRSLHGLMGLVDRGLFQDTASHGLLSRVATMALLQHALPGELEGTTWRDPWTDPTLFSLEE